MSVIKGSITATSKKKNRLAISLGMFKGIKSSSIRQWFLNKQSEWPAAKKRISLSNEKFGFSLKAIRDHNQKTQHWLQDEDTTYQEVLKNHEAAIEDGKIAMFKKRPYECKKESWRSSELFRVEAEGGRDKLILNTNHDLIKIILETSCVNNNLTAESQKETLLQIFEILLLSFARTQRLFEEGQKVDQEALFELIMSNWGLLAQRYLDQSRGGDT